MFDTDGEQAFRFAADAVLVQHLQGEPVTTADVRAQLFHAIASHILEGNCECEGSDYDLLDYMRKEMRAVAKGRGFDGAIFDEVATEIREHWTKVRAERAAKVTA